MPDDQGPSEDRPTKEQADPDRPTLQAGPPQEPRHDAATPTPETALKDIWRWIETFLGRRSARVLAFAVVLLFVIAPASQYIRDSLWPPLSRWAASKVPLPQFDAARVGVAVLWLENDPNDHAREILLHEFRTVKGLEVRPVQRLISVDLDHLPDSVAAGHAHARQLLKDTGAAIVLWGKVLQSGEQRALELFLTPSDACSLPGEGRYAFYNGLHVPEKFWGDVSSLLALVACSESSKVSDYGLSRPQRLRLVSRMKPLMENAGWNASARRAIADTVAMALMRLGEEDVSDPSTLLAAREVYRSLATERLREESETRWASYQLHLGIIEFRLASRNPDLWRMESAIECLRSALSVYQKGNDVGARAAVETVLGGALSTLGRQRNEASPIQEATRILERAIDDYAKVGNRVDWAQAQSNMGNALARLAEVTGDTRLLERAAVAHRSATAADIRDRAPVVWATAQVNLGQVLCDAGSTRRPGVGLRLGARESNEVLLNEAVGTLRAVLTLLTAENHPALWAKAQYNLGRALSAIGQRRDGTIELEEAAASFRRALSVTTAAGDRDTWLDIQHYRAATLDVLGKRKLDAATIGESITALRDSLRVEEDAKERSDILKDLAYEDKVLRWIDCRCGLAPQQAR